MVELKLATISIESVKVEEPRPPIVRVAVIAGLIR